MTPRAKARAKAKGRARERASKSAIIEPVPFAREPRSPPRSERRLSRDWTATRPSFW